MIRGAGKLIKADSVENILNRPEKKTNLTVVYETLKKHKDGLTTNEISMKSGVLSRRVNESLKRMKQRGMVKEKLCRCQRTIIYYIL